MAFGSSLVVLGIVNFAIAQSPGAKRQSRGEKTPTPGENTQTQVVKNQSTSASKPGSAKVAEPPVESKESEDKTRQQLPVTGKFKNGNSDSYPRKPLENSSGYPQDQGHSYQYSYRYVIGTRNGVPVTRYGNAQATVTVNGQTQTVQSDSLGGRQAVASTEQLMRMKRNFVFDAGDRVVRVFHTPRLIRLRVKAKEKRAKEQVYTARNLKVLKEDAPEAYELYTRFLPGLPEDAAPMGSADAVPKSETSSLMNETLRKMEQTTQGAPIMNELLKDLKNQAKK